PDGAKCRGRQRTIAVENADALWALEKLLERAAELGANEPQHYLFPFRDPKKNAFDATRPMTVSGLKRRWEEVREASKLKRFRMYDTRHTAITRLAEQGVPIAVIMSLAGHLSPRMTAHYTQISEAVQRRWLQGPLIPGPVAPHPRQPHLYAVPAPQEAPLARAAERPGYTTIYIGGVAVSIPA
ncbi:MAG: tyrosine-type recombinase/integrase, partial [Terriglobia bacterium]|nr:tyrosine-type recombinase/integrase [Terriglobia bacterium]